MLHRTATRSLLTGTALFMMIACAVSVGKLEAADNTADIILRASCVDAECHPKYREAKYAHSPVILEKCTVCHESSENRHVFRLVSEDKELCTFCHKMRLQNVVHKPVAEGKCLDCHEPHGSAFPFMLKSDPSKHLCLSCHQEESFLNNEYLHAPVAQGACILCHQGHSSWNDKLVIDKGNGLCLFCHKKEFEPLLEKRHVHKPILESCQKCHDPHGSGNQMLLPEEEPYFCYTCHEDIANAIRSSRNVHDAIVTERSCSNCHDPHASALPRLLEKPMIDVCLTCHNRELVSNDGTILHNIAALLEENPSKHGPIRQNNCVACHNPHASNFFRQLVNYFPEDFYAPFNLGEYNLCFQCHIKDTFLEERTTALTNFRDGDLNLHFLHVNKKEKGRTCRACHAIHASNQPVHVRSIVPYGNWEFPVVFSSDADGGTCSPGCHFEKRYSRKYKKIEDHQ